MRGNLPPLVLHVVFQFSTGGLENGLVNLINHMPESAYRHAVLALRNVTDFRRRVRRDDVAFISLHKGPGHGFQAYPKMWRAIRELRPAIVHTRNLGPLEMQMVAALAGVRARIHGEHGRDIDDPGGNSRRHQWVRRVYAPFVQRFVALSQDLQQYLIGKVGIAPERVSQIYNGVDAERFRPAVDGPERIVGCPFNPGEHWLVGTVGRMQAIKDPVLLARAFVRALELRPELRPRARLAMVGDGPVRPQAQAILDEAGVSSLSWLPGERHDVPDVMRGLSCFVLPSLSEGISNTILEAMATGLPVLATDVGGNAELVLSGSTGDVIPAGDVEAMAHSLIFMAADPRLACMWGAAGRKRVERHFSMQAMVSAYQNLYDRQLGRASHLVGSA